MFVSLQQINMIQEPNLPFHSQDYFSRLENLQTMRENIKQLIKQDISNLQTLLEHVENTFADRQMSSEDSMIYQQRKKQNELQLFRYLSEQNRERSDNLSVLGHLILKMVDFIQQQRHRHECSIQMYEKKIDELTYTIDEMNNRKSAIENDVQIFREQLQDAKCEIDQLIEERDLYHQNRTMANQHIEEQLTLKIQGLEKELVQLRDNMAYFNSNTPIKSQLFKNQQKKTLKYSCSQQYFITSNILKDYRDDSFPAIENLKQIQLNKALQQQNQRLRRQIQELEKIKNLEENRCDEFYIKNIQQVMQDKKSQSRIIQNGENIKLLQLKEDSRINLLSKVRSLTSITSYFNQSISHIISKQQQKNMQMSKHRLASDLSQKSFVNYFRQQCISQANKFVYIGQDENNLVRNQSRQIFESLDSYNKISQLQTKESQIQNNHTQKTNPIKPTQKCVKKQQNIKNSIKKSVKIDKKTTDLSKSSVIGKEANKQQSKGFCSSIFNFVVNNRVRRTSQKANSGFSAFLI